jgi:thiol:disulfide interchange protein
MQSHKVSLGIALAFASLFVPHNALVAQTPAQDKPAEKAKPPPPYDEQADAKQVIAAAITRAKQENRRVLIQWGANWCSSCVKLHALYKSDKAIAHELSYEYDLVLVDIGKWDKNVDLAKQYGADFKADGAGVPYLTVLDGDGKVLANQVTGTLEDPAIQGGGHDPKKVLDFLVQYQAKPLVAEDVRTAAFARAKAEDKRVFEHFGAPW